MMEKKTPSLLRRMEEEHPSSFEGGQTRRASHPKSNAGRRRGYSALVEGD